jgi:hypothetical protein
MGFQEFDGGAREQLAAGDTQALGRRLRAPKDLVRD